MTSWIDLKTATEKEKNDDETRKKEKKKRIKSQRKERLEKKDRPNKKLKVEKAKINTVKASSSGIQPVKVKPIRTISKIIENPVEVKIGKWAVIEFEEPST